MTNILLAASLLLLFINLGLLGLLLSRSKGPDQQLGIQLATLRESQEKLERQLREEMAKNRDETNTANKQFREEMAKGREEANSSNRQGREEMAKSLRNFNDSLLSRMTEVSTMQKNQLDSFSQQLAQLTQLNEQKLEQLRLAVEERLKSLQEDNGKKLEEMRKTVDEKLHATLEQRLGESFKLVSERLEQVHKGLGEMQTLASGVGDLKKVLTNVKTRGTWGEVQLHSLLEQILTAEQYAANVATKLGSADRVEFALKLPGKDERQGFIYLPIDAKFPQEDYQRLVEAQEQADPILAEEAAKQLEARIKLEAKNIREKYLDPPQTTDFGIMFLPTEGLYAEVLRRPGLSDSLQRDHRVMIAGPTTLSALLNSLQMGFRTLAIEKRSSEVWQLLGAVKSEFGKFGDILEKTQKKLQEANNVIESAAVRTRAIERKLKGVEALPAVESQLLLGEVEAAEQMALHE